MNFFVFVSARGRWGRRCGRLRLRWPSPPSLADAGLGLGRPSPPGSAEALLGQRCLQVCDFLAQPYDLQGPLLICSPVCIAVQLTHGLGDGAFLSRCLPGVEPALHVDLHESVLGGLAEVVRHLALVHPLLLRAPLLPPDPVLLPPQRAPCLDHLLRLLLVRAPLGRPLVPVVVLQVLLNGVAGVLDIVVVRVAFIVLFWSFGGPAHL